MGEGRAGGPVDRFSSREADHIQGVRLSSLESWANFGTKFWPPVKISTSAQKPDLDPEPGDFGQLLISGDDQIDIRVRLRRCKDQSVGHAKRLEAGPKVSCHIGDGDVNGQD